MSADKRGARKRPVSSLKQGALKGGKPRAPKQPMLAKRTTGKGRARVGKAKN